MMSQASVVLEGQGLVELRPGALSDTEQARRRTGRGDGVADSLRSVEVDCEQVEHCQWVRGDGRLWRGAMALDCLDSCRFRVQLDNFVTGMDLEVDVLIDTPSTPAPGGIAPQGRAGYRSRNVAQKTGSACAADTTGDRLASMTGS